MVYNTIISGHGPSALYRHQLKAGPVFSRPVPEGGVMKFKTFLNPVDGSDHSRRSTEYAIALAKQFNARIILLHCHNRFPVVLSEPYYQQALDEIM